MTREEFIGIAAEGVIRDAYGCDPATCSIFTTNRAVAAATAALDAVGAWDLYELAQQMEPADYPHVAEILAGIFR